MVGSAAAQVDCACIKMYGTKCWYAAGCVILNGYIVLKVLQRIYRYTRCEQCTFTPP